MTYPSLAILIPIYREPERLLKQNYEAFSRLNYPGKVQVHWLFHESETETIEKVRTLGMFEQSLKSPQKVPFKIIIDNLNPPLKANALNNALKEVEEEIITVFDVDHIIPDAYIKRGVELLMTENVALTQGPVFCYNANRNWITKYMQMEYESWHLHKQLALQDAYGWFPVSGTGYFIRKKDLIEIGGWTPCITEDIDLGTRLHKAGKKLRLFYQPCPQYEECPETLLNLLRQQARWRKGWAQHHAMHDLKKNFPRIWYIMSELKWISLTHCLAVISVTLSVLSLFAHLLIFVAVPFSVLSLGLLLFGLPYLMKRKHWGDKAPKFYGVVQTLRWVAWGLLYLKGYIEIKFGYKPLRYYHTKKKGVQDGRALRRLLQK